MPRGCFERFPGKASVKALTKKHVPVQSRRLLMLLIIFACSSCQGRTEPMPERVLRRQVMELARNLVGIPYRFGGIDIDGFDCSGLVYYVYDCFGIAVPRSAREQGRMGKAIPLQRAAPGDILIFKIGRIWHSALFLDDRRFIHSPNAGGWVRIEALNEYWLSRLRRVITL